MNTRPQPIVRHGGPEIEVPVAHAHSDFTTREPHAFVGDDAHVERNGAAASANYICIAAHLPPPVNGCSTINAHIVQALADRAAIEVVDLAPPASAGPLVRYAVRLFRALNAIRTLLSARRAPRRVLYMQIDGGDGILLNILIALAARFRGFSAHLHHHSFAYINRHSRLMDVLIRAAPKHSRHIVLCEEMGAQLSQVYRATWRRSHARLLLVSNALLPLPTPARSWEG
jgi:hypothetical protein